MSNNNKPFKVNQIKNFNKFIFNYYKETNICKNISEILTEKEYLSLLNLFYEIELKDLVDKTMTKIDWLMTCGLIYTNQEINKNQKRENKSNPVYAQIN